MALDTARRLAERLARRVSNARQNQPRGSEGLVPTPGSALLAAPAPAAPQLPAVALEAPLLSVIVWVHNEQEQLATCLDSLLKQTLQRIEIIVVDDGSTDHSADILARYAAVDPRITVLTRPESGYGAARNAGIEAATAPFLTFLDSDDTIPAAAYEYLVGVLQRTRSDFAVGAVKGLQQGRNSRPRWVLDVHRVERLGITIEEFPDAMQDVLACNRVFRRDFWDAKIGRFPTGVTYEGQIPLVAAYLRAASFDLLPATTSSVRIRQDATTVWQQSRQISFLRDRVAASELAWEVVSTEASDEVAGAWLGRVLDYDLSRFVENALKADDEYRDVVRAAAARFVRRATGEAWRHVRVERKLRLALAALGEWEAADQVVEYFRVHGSIPQTRVVEGRVLADLPFTDELPDFSGLAAGHDLYELSEPQTQLSACIQRARWTPEGRLEVEGWAFVSGVDLTREELSLEASLWNPSSGQVVPLSVERFSSAAITRWSNHVFHSYDDAGFRLRVDADALPRSPKGSSSRWQLRLEVEAAGVRRAGPVHATVRSGIATRMRARDLTRASDVYRVLPLMDDDLGFALQVRFDRLRASALGADGQQVHGTIAALRPLAAPLTHAVARQRGKIVARAALEHRADGSYDFRLSLPARGRAPHWDFRVLDEAGRPHRVSWPSEREHGREIGSYGVDTARWRRSPRGYVQLSTQAVVFRAGAVEVTDDQVSVDVSLSGVDGQVLQEALLCSALLDVPVSSVRPVGPGAPDRYRLVFPARVALWGAEEERPLPSGTYTVELPLDDGSTVPCGVVPDLMEQMPIESLTSAHGASVARRPGTDRLTVELRAPLTDDERGPSAQHRLSQWFTELDPQPREQVFFQCYRGEFATDSQLAIHSELRRRGTPLELVWGVADHSVRLPEGARPVLLGSRAWYEAIAVSRYLCNNNDFDRFFHRRPYQEFLQTFHGYPFKSMGLSFWRARQFSKASIRYEITRRTQAWTSILLPESFCEEIYRTEYLYQGEVLVSGYPRNDELVTADPHSREDILRRLGVSPDKTVVMYAPTWRDTIATGDWSAEFYDALELDVLAEALGPDHVLLLRGHNFNMREGVLKPSHSQIVDVTRYPEISDLILAADVAILDYSSLRFDWVLTGKPVLFFVPDLADYLSARTALFEYGPTAPGPLLSTTAEVIEAVHNLESVSMDYVQARQDFNERFNRLHDGHATRRVVDAFFGPRAGV